MDNPNAFKTIIFYGVKDEKSISLKQSFSHCDFIKVFQTSGIDEIKQILDMSSKSAVVTDDLDALERIKEDVLSGTKGKLRKYYFDWDLKMSSTASSNLSLDKVTVLKTPNVEDVLGRLELYLFGKIHVVKDKSFNPRSESEEGNNFFTLLEFVDGSWKVMASSHEKEDDVGDLLGKDWNQFLNQTKDNAQTIIRPSENKLTQKPFYEIIYPHFQNDVIHKLSIVHLNMDDQSEENLKKIRLFLQNIDPK